MSGANYYGCSLGMYSCFKAYVILYSPHVNMLFFGKNILFLW